MQERIQSIIQKSIEVKQKLWSDPVLVSSIGHVVDLCVKCFSEDKKVLFCGNGGSAADAQHLAAEFSGRFYQDRRPLFAEALHVNTSYLTAVANDYSYDEVYSRLVLAKGRPGDVLFAISTSGNSKNILRAMDVAKTQQMLVVAMTGASGGTMRNQCDVLLNMPSQDTPRIQEAHILVGHIICELVEERLFQ